MWLAAAIMFFTAGGADGGATARRSLTSFARGTAAPAAWASRPRQRNETSRVKMAPLRMRQVIGRGAARLEVPGRKSPSLSMRPVAPQNQADTAAAGPPPARRRQHGQSVGDEDVPLVSQETESAAPWLQPQPDDAGRTSGAAHRRD